MIKDELKQETAEEEKTAPYKTAKNGGWAWAKDPQDVDPQAKAPQAAGPETDAAANISDTAYTSGDADDTSDIAGTADTSGSAGTADTSCSAGTADISGSAGTSDTAAATDVSDAGRTTAGAGKDADGTETGKCADNTETGKDADDTETGKDADTAKKGLFGKKKKAEETVSKASYDELKGKYDELNGKLDDLNNQYLRLNADFQNFRRRNENTRSEAYTDAKASLITDLLGVLDNFDRALASPTEDTRYAEGVELIHKTFLDVVTKAGLTEIEAEGKPFDPNLHNAVMKQPKEGVESDTVITVFQKGYMLGGKVLRPSMVIVAE